jgi:lipoate-protein ligase B
MDGLTESMTKTISVIKLRAPMRFQDALELQKVHGAELETSAHPLAKLFLLQHSPVYTLGRKTEPGHLLCSEDDLAVRTGAEVVHADRGGSVTYHGPGQLVAYLLLNLRVWEFGIHQHLDLLEDVGIRTLGRFGIKGHREEGMTGIWVRPSPTEPSAKICAIGVSARRWVTYHGLSLNVDLKLDPFKEVIPCGLAGREVTTMAKALRREVDVSDVEAAICASFGETYQATVETGMV